MKADVSLSFTRAPLRHEQGVPIFVDAAPMTSCVDAEDTFKNFFKAYPHLYNFLFAVVGPSLFTGVTGSRFVHRLPPNSRVLHAGSGPRRLSPCSTNVDLFLYPGVDVVADIRDLPFPDASFDAVVCEQVLEHVPEPWRAAAEFQRIVRPGGLILIGTPFCFPWHPSPSDFSRWTGEGLASLFPRCRVVERGVLAGPFSALNAFIPTFAGILLSCGIPWLRIMWQYLFLVLLAPLKLLDILAARLPGAEYVAAAMYVIVSPCDSHA